MMRIAAYGLLWEPEEKRAPIFVKEKRMKTIRPHRKYNRFSSLRAEDQPGKLIW